jgi:hypothetical protein
MSNPSLLNIPYRFKGSKLYSQIPDSGLGDFVVSRTTTPTANLATRVNASGFIETVADNVPRLDYPLGGIANGCPALLVEPSAQNLALQSENFGTTWSSVALLAFGSGSVLNTSATLDPYGTNVADLIVANTSVTQHRIEQTTASAAGSYTFSIFLKAAGYGFARLRIGGTGAVFNLTTGVVSATDSGIVSSIQSYGNGWYRCIASKAVSVANEIVRVNIQSTQSTADFGGDGTSGIYIFGSQYELGAVATSYIPTTIQAITRGVEVVNKTGVSGLIGQTEGTMYAEFEYKTNIAEKRLIALSNGTSSDRIMLWTLNNILYAQVEAGSIILASPITEGYHKVAFAYQQSGVSGTLFASLDGGGVVSGTSAAFPASLTDINIGKNEATATSTFFWNARIRSVAIYPTRLTNAQLQALTT